MPGQAAELRDRVVIVTGAGTGLGRSHAHTPTGRLIEVGAGSYADMFTGRAAGIEFGADVPIEAAMLAERYEEIFDRSHYATPQTSMEVLASVFGGPFEYGGAHRNR